MKPKSTTVTDPTKITNLIHNHAGIDFHDPETASQAIEKLFEGVTSRNSTLGICGCMEAMLVTFRNAADAKAGITEFIKTARKITNIIWVILIENKEAIFCVRDSLLRNLTSTKNICIAIKPGKDAKEQAELLEALTTFTSLFKVVLLDSEDHQTPESLIPQVNWVISDAGVNRQSREVSERAKRIRATCAKAKIPLLELGTTDVSAASAPPQLTHPFPANWGINFTRPGLQMEDPMVGANVVEVGEIVTPTTEATSGNETKLSSKPSRFEQLHATVQQWLHLAPKAGMALLEIREGKHWRDGGYKNWSDYCQSLLHKDRSYINKIIKVAEIISVLKGNNPPTDGDGLAILPMNIAQGHPLGKLSDASSQSTAWKMSVERASGQPTAAIVSEVVSELTPAPKQKTARPNAKTKRRKLIASMRSVALKKTDWDRILELISQLETL